MSRVTKKSGIKKEMPVSIGENAINDIISSSSGLINKKGIQVKVNNFRIITSTYIRNYITVGAINKEFEMWIQVIKDVIKQTEINRDYVPTEEQNIILEECKKRTSEYEKNYGLSVPLETNLKKATSDYERLKIISSNMKFKVNLLAYEIITYVINYMVREIITYTCDKCYTNEVSRVGVQHIPLDTLRTKLGAGLYMDTKVMHDLINNVENATEVESEEEEVEEVEEDSEETEDPEETEENDEIDDSEVKVTDDSEVKVKSVNIENRLIGFLCNIFKEIKGREEKFSKLKFAKNIKPFLIKIISQVLDKYIFSLKLLLNIRSGHKTINEAHASTASLLFVVNNFHLDKSLVNKFADSMEVRLEDYKEEMHDKKIKSYKDHISKKTTEINVFKEKYAKEIITEESDEFNCLDVLKTYKCKYENLLEILNIQDNLSKGIITEESYEYKETLPALKKSKIEYENKLKELNKYKIKYDKMLKELNSLKIKDDKTTSPQSDLDQISEIIEKGDQNEENKSKKNKKNKKQPAAEHA